MIDTDLTHLESSMRQIKMGTDIHVYVEKFDEETQQWFMTRNSINRAEDRNYKFFDALAGVRSENLEDTPKPKGLPEGLSLGVNDEINSWGDDAHSRSWDTLEDFLTTLKKHCYDFDDIEIADLRIRQDNLNKQEKTRLRHYNDFEYYVADWACEWDGTQGKHAYNPENKYRVVYFFDN